MTFFLDLQTLLDLLGNPLFSYLGGILSTDTLTMHCQTTRLRTIRLAGRNAFAITLLASALATMNYFFTRYDIIIAPTRFYNFPMFDSTSYPPGTRFPGRPHYNLVPHS